MLGIILFGIWTFVMITWRHDHKIVGLNSPKRLNFTIKNCKRSSLLFCTSSRTPV